MQVKLGKHKPIFHFEKFHTVDGTIDSEMINVDYCKVCISDFILVTISAEFCISFL